MKTRRLVRRGLLHHRRTHLAAAAVAALAAAVVVAALGVGDSVREGMAAVERNRLGRVARAVQTPGRTFRSDLGPELSAALPGTVSAALRLPASIARPDGTARLASGRVVGVDAAFWSLSPAGHAPAGFGAEDGVAVSERVAERLGIDVGDRLVLRVETPSGLPRGTPLASDSDAVTTISATVAVVLDADAFGAFSLEIGARPPASVFLPLTRLQTAVNQSGRANTLLFPPEAGSAGDVERALATRWRLGDAGLRMRLLDPERGFEIASRRVLFDAPLADAVTSIEGAAGILTWLVDEFEHGDRRTPYSIVAALPRAHGLIPDDLADDEILVNRWLADDLAVSAGDRIRLRYSIPGQRRRLEKRETEFRVRAVLPIAGAAADRDLMPEIPGLTHSENCRDWDPGFPLDLDRIRDEDEAYWDEYRGTPKAFVSLRTGRRLWASPFGSLTSVRLPAAASPEAVESALRERLAPAAVGLVVTDVARSGEAARAGGMDFGALFLGFSFLLVAAALLLAALVAALNLSARKPEMATLRALGYSPRRVLGLFAAEQAAVSAAGGLAGCVLGVVLQASTLSALDSVWKDVAGAFELPLTVRPGTLLLGGLSGAAASFAAVLLVTRRAVRASVRASLAEDERLAATLSRGRTRRCVGHWVALGFAVAAGVLAATGGAGRDPATAGTFFGSGALLLCAALSLVWYALGHLGAARPGRRLGTRGLAWRNLGRHRGRSLATVGVLAFGVFMFLGVTVFRRDRATADEDESSGTGGFALIGETATAVVHDLDSDEGRAFYGLQAADLQGVRVVGLRRRGGDDASCRSLTRAAAPPILGVDPEALAGRFTFVKTAGGSSWPELLRADDESTTVAGVIDQATFWTLGKGLGDVVHLTDEVGEAMPVRIVGVIDNSILHGHLVVADAAFKRRFPGHGGARAFLIDAPDDRTDAVAALLTRQLEDRGLALERTEDRLNSYNAVENTYLAIFQALGGIGLLLGSVGLALLVGRSVVERRSELALLGAVGFTRRRLVRLVTGEHVILLALGLGVGLVSSLLSLVPALLSPGAVAAPGAIVITLVALAAAGVVWTALATRLALRGSLLSRLRNE